MAPKLARLLALLPCVRAQASSGHTFSVTSYDSEGCTGTIVDMVTYSGVQVGECETAIQLTSMRDGSSTSPDADERALGVRAIQYSCDAGELVETDYRDAECTEPWTRSDYYDRFLRHVAQDIHNDDRSISTSDAYSMLDEHCEFGFEDELAGGLWRFPADRCVPMFTCSYPDTVRVRSLVPMGDGSNFLTVFAACMHRATRTECG